MMTLLLIALIYLAGLSVFSLVFFAHWQLNFSLIANQHYNGDIITAIAFALFWPIMMLPWIVDTERPTIKEQIWFYKSGNYKLSNRNYSKPVPVKEDYISNFKRTALK